MEAVKNEAAVASVGGNMSFQTDGAFVVIREGKGQHTADDNGRFFRDSSQHSITEFMTRATQDFFPSLSFLGEFGERRRHVRPSVRRSAGERDVGLARTDADGQTHTSQWCPFDRAYCVINSG